MDPSADAPCKEIANGFTQGDFNDYDTVKAFGKDKDVLTIEIEHVNTKALKELEKEGVKVYPQTRIIELVQDKGAQKTFYKQHGFPTSDFVLVENKEQAIAKFKEGGVVQKLRTGGYDGRGVQLLRTQKDVVKAFDAPSVIEELVDIEKEYGQSDEKIRKNQATKLKRKILVDIEKELAVIVARNSRGEVKSFPVVDMEFNEEANLVEFLYAPASISTVLETKLRQNRSRRNFPCNTVLTGSVHPPKQSRKTLERAHGRT